MSIQCSGLYGTLWGGSVHLKSNKNKNTLSKLAETFGIGLFQKFCLEQDTNRDRCYTCPMFSFNVKVQVPFMCLFWPDFNM